MVGLRQPGAGRPGRRTEAAMRIGLGRHSMLVAVMAVVRAGLGSAPAIAATCWSIVPTPNPGTTNLIGGVVAFGASDV